MPKNIKQDWLVKGATIIWNNRKGTVMDVDTSAQKTQRGQLCGWPIAVWVLFDGEKSWSCVNAVECSHSTIK